MFKVKTDKANNKISQKTMKAIANEEFETDSSMDEINLSDIKSDGASSEESSGEDTCEVNHCTNDSSNNLKFVNKKKMLR